DADDVKHDVAIVYAESPFVLSIFTDKSNYDEITQIANDIYGILK
ncbi:TPA: serine hydrolase, partial [Streptococcus suis]